MGIRTRLNGELGIRGELLALWGWWAGVHLRPALAQVYRQEAPRLKSQIDVVS
jgi:hypothetical protein